MTKPTRLTNNACSRRLSLHFPRAFAAFTGVFTAFVLAGCGKGEGEVHQRPAPRVEVWTVPLETLLVRRSWAGVIEPLRIVPVQAPRAGQIKQMSVSPGDRVQPGDLLAVLTGPDLLARRSALEERLSVLTDELQRWRELGQARAAGPGEISAAQLRQLEVREQLDELESAFDTLELRSPVEGVVLLAAFDLASHLDEGREVFRLADFRSYGMRLSLPARETKYLEDLGKLRLLDASEKHHEISRIVFREGADRGFVFAEIYLAGSGVRPTEATLTYEGGEEAPVVPWTAVASDSGRPWVAVVAGDPATVQRRFIETGRAHSSGIAVHAGVAPGERVIRMDPRAHPDGRQVTPMTTDR